MSSTLVLSCKLSLNLMSQTLEQILGRRLKLLRDMATNFEYEVRAALAAKGEPATWVGIVLSGSLAALVDGQVVGTMGTGSIVGAGVGTGTGSVVGTAVGAG